MLLLLLRHASSSTSFWRSSSRRRRRRSLMGSSGSGYYPQASFPSSMRGTDPLPTLPIRRPFHTQTTPPPPPTTTSSTTTSSSSSSFFQTLQSYMITRKRLLLTLPNGQSLLSYQYNLSDLAGHGSFLFLAFSYMENDFYHLRLYAMSGITLSILFQYYREVPLWIPIRWNSLFLIINAVMIAFLLRDDLAAKNLGEEEQRLYEEVFELKGMTRTDFLKLISKATRIQVPRNEKLVDETKVNTRVYLVHSGEVSVRKGGSEVGRIQEKMFVGAMSFLAWDSAQEAELHSHHHGSSSGSSSSSSSSSSKEQEEEVVGVVVGQEGKEGGGGGGGGGMLCKQLVDGEVTCRSVTSSSSTTTTTTTTTTDDSKGDWLWGLPEMISPWMEWIGSQLTLVTNNPPPPPPTSSSSTTSPPPPPATPTTTTTTSSTDKQKEEEEGQNGRADAVCVTPCVVYYWRFKDLRTLKQHHPSIGLTLERCLSDDLNRKMLTTWSSETKERYKQLLLGATSDGQVADHVKLMLKNVRDRWGISESDHLNLLRGLGWSAAEYNTGFLGVKSLESLHRYETLLKNELADGLTDESRIRLRHFRQMHHLSSAVHVTALRRLGWTLDDYEAGIRTSHIV